MKSKLLLPLAQLLLATFAMSLVACAGPRTPQNYSAARAVDPYPFHHFNHSCGHNNSHRSH